MYFPAYDGWSAFVLLAPFLSRDCHGSRSAPPVHRQIAPDLYGVRGRQAPVPRHYEVLVCLVWGATLAGDGDRTHGPLPGKFGYSADTLTIE